MAKTVYITETQFNFLQKYIAEEANNVLNITVTPQKGQSMETAIEASKQNVEQVAGSNVADNSNFTIKGSALEGKKYTKKQIEKCRLNKVIKEGRVFNKTDFTKYILGK